jgi:hypothetical protein
MKAFYRSIVLVVLTADAARGADAPLLVAVEVAPGTDIGPAEVRRAVAAELGTAVVEARDPIVETAGDLLRVALEPREIRMSLRAGTAPVVSRTIAVSSDRTGRLRSIGWLAGNLVRDQVGPIVATRETPAVEPEPAALSANDPPVVPAAPPPANPPAGVAYPPASAPPPEPAAVASQPASAPGAIPHAAWAITMAGGPVVTVVRDSNDTSATSGGIFQLEVQRQRSPDSLLYGLAFAVGPDNPRHYAGAAAFAGEAWRGQAFFAEATLGLGLEALQGYATIGSSTGTAPTPGNPGMVTSSSEARVPTGTVPGLFVRAAGTGGLHVSQAFDLVVQLGGHLSSSGSIGSYVGATGGVRLRL